MATALPTARARRWVPPAPGITPMLISGCPNCAVSLAMITSQSIMSSQPPPSAQPLTAATIGFLIRLMRSHVANWSRSYISIADALGHVADVGAGGPRPFAAGEQDDVDLRIVRRTASICSASWVISAGFSAFRTFGRLSG